MVKEWQERGSAGFDTLVNVDSPGCHTPAATAMNHRGAISIFTNDRAVLEPAMAAVLECGRGLHLASSAPDAFTKIQRELGGVDMFIVDMDVEVHGVALLNALSFCADRVPVIVITNLEQADMEPVARSKGAVACYGKPVTAQQIREAIEKWADRSADEPLPPEAPMSRRHGPIAGEKYGPGFRGTLTGGTPSNDKTASH
jgi:DNA-binding NtrC family response regulator